jgi:DNA-binding protein HU-beta
MQSQTAGSAVGRIALLWRSGPMHCLVRGPLSTPVFYGFNWGRRGTSLKSATAIFLKRCDSAAIKQRLDMTKTELQVALAVATETNKRTAGVFLDTLSNLAYKEIKKNGEFVLPGFGKLVKQKRKARTGFNPKTQQKIKIPAKTVVKFRVAKAAKDAVLGVKK